MRWKIILVNAGIVAIMGLLTYVLMATAITDLVSNPAERKRAVEQSLRAANAQLALDALRVERWLEEQGRLESVGAVFSAGTAEARSDKATTEANRLRDAAIARPEFARMAPALVLLVDAQGVVVGRNGSPLMRGDKLAEVYPSLAASLKSGVTASDLWVNRERQEQLFASYAPVRSDSGAILGALVVGTPLNDERLSRTSDLTSGADLVIAVPAESSLEALASSGAGKADVIMAAGPLGAETAKASLGSAGVVVADSPANGVYFGATPLSAYGSGARAVVFSTVPASIVASVSSLMWPIVGVTVLGLILVLMGGVLLGNYISRPISDLEEGLLAAINGRTDFRFEIEHAELGGLVTRINSLLNVFTGTPEDTTDEQGRPSRPAGTSKDFDQQR